ncbi:MAG: hypothetical protein QW650_00330 [Thermofilum sp.]
MLALPKPPSVPPPDPSKIKSIAGRYKGTQKKFSPLKALNTLFNVYIIGSSAFSALSSTGTELQFL